MRQLFFIFILLVNYFTSFASSVDSIENEKYVQEVLKRDQSIKYQTGKVDINEDIELDVPKGFKFMSKADAEYVVFDFWGNPKSDDILGMIVREDYTILDPSSWAFILTYENTGYVKDEDAEKIDYDEMMDNFHKEEGEENKARVAEGFPTLHILNWAMKPYYDKSNNVLHWAKSIKFGDSQDTTLNYDVRILGRKGILSLNAVGVIGQLEDIKSNIPSIIHIAKFKKGSSYLDFDPKVDKVAAYTIGGLVAGKILAKAGILALLLKNIKLVFLAFAAIFAGFKDKILALFGKTADSDKPVS